MKETLNSIQLWYKGTKTKEWMGPGTLKRGLQQVVTKYCGIDLPKEGHRNQLQWSCGPHTLRLYEEKAIDCFMSAEECPDTRKTSPFLGAHYGIFEPGMDGRLVAWPRFEECTSFGCSTGGWDES